MKNLPETTTAGMDHEHIQQENIEVGSWYWQTVTTWDDKECDVLGCVTHIGSNYANIKTVDGGEYRVLFEDWDEECTREHDYEKIIKDEVDETQEKLKLKLQEVNDLTKRLGVGSVKALPEPTTEYALTPLHGTEKIDQYKNDLVLAKEKQLPELFEEMKKLNGHLTTWLKAKSIPMVAMAESMKGSLDLVNDRIFNVELYAGLVETATKIKSGKPAGMGDKLHVMQRRHYMDEECLVNYTHGGMNFKNIGQFDKWLSKKENMDRIFPFPKCLVSFRVRRKRKNYRQLSPLVAMSYSMEDDITYLYIRNGKQLYRIDSEMNFGGKLFPDITEFDAGEKLWALQRGRDISEDSIIPDRLYQDMIKKEKERKKAYKKWEKANPKKDDWDNPHRHGHIHNLGSYEPFDKSSAFFDDIEKVINNQLKSYNRIAIIIQGLFDRSVILHPHTSVQIWKQESFDSAIELVRDSDHALYSGDKPDFEAYRARLNKSIKTGTIVIGQDHYWQTKEAVKENARQAADYRIQYDSNSRYETFSPYGNPGPGFLAVIEKFTPRSKKCRFKWTRQRRRDRYYNNHRINCSIIIPVEELLNVEAYTPGDYKIFFNDPRTRKEYLKWATLLLSAEDYHAGKLKLRKSDEEEDIY